MTTNKIALFEQKEELSPALTKKKDPPRGA